MIFYLFIGNNYDLSAATDLPTLNLTVWHRGSLGVADVPMGEINIPLDSINPDGDVTEQSYPLQASGRMKTVTGEVNDCLLQKGILLTVLLSIDSR